MGKHRGLPPLYTREAYIGPGEALLASLRFLDRDFEPHTHDFFEMECILSGRGTHLLNGIGLSLSAGSIYLLTPADVHAVRVEEPLRYYGVMFSEELFSGSALGDRLLSCRGVQMELTREEQARLLPLFSQLAEEAAGRKELAVAYQQSLMQCILIVLLRKIFSGGQEGESVRGVRGALLYVHRHFREDLTLEEAAAAVGLSPHYFSGLFRKAVGRNFSEYICALRVQYARNLLVSGDRPVTDICFASGFGSFSSFSRAFQKQYGMTPMQVRKTGSDL